MDEILKPVLDWYGSLTLIGRVFFWCVLVYVVFRTYYFWDNKRLKKVDD